jgi:hypothetical protein
VNENVYFSANIAWRPVDVLGMNVDENGRSCERVVRVSVMSAARGLVAER